MPLPRTMRYTSEEVDAVDVSPFGPLHHKDEHMPGSYINFYNVGGRALVVPSFDPESDERAKKVFEAAFPGLPIRFIPDARDILVGGGNIHCITQQQPVV
jgi:agmatine deiminase